MPAVIPFIPLIAAGVTGTGAVVASAISANTSGSNADKAIAFQTQQENERRREWDIQTAAAKKQWDTSQANLAPYRAARLEILRKHGLNVPDVVPPKEPDYSGGPPPGWKPGDPIGGGTTAPKSSNGTSPWLLGGAGLGLTGLGTGLAAMYGQPPDSQYNTIGGPYTTTTAGVPGGPAGPPSSLMNPAESGIVSPANLSNWSDWSNYYGTPGQTYQGE